MVENLILERLKYPDCNAGAIFDNLELKNCPNPLIIIKSLYNLNSYKNKYKQNIKYINCI